MEVTRKPDFYLDESELVHVEEFKNSEKGLGQGETNDIYAKFSFMKTRNRKKQEKILLEKSNKDRVESFKKSGVKEASATSELRGPNSFEKQFKEVEFATFMEHNYPALKEDPEAK